MKGEKWLAVLLALIIAGIIANKQSPGSSTNPPPVPTTVVTGR